MLLLTYIEEWTAIRKELTGEGTLPIYRYTIYAQAHAHTIMNKLPSEMYILTRWENPFHTAGNIPVGR